MIKKIGTLSFLLYIAIFFNGVPFVLAQEATPTPTVTPTPTQSSTTPTPTPDDSGKVDEIQKNIRELEAKLSTTQAQEKTLSSQITVMDSQIRLTQLRINSTQAELKNLVEDIATATDKIDHLEESLTEITRVLLNRIVATYQKGTVPTFEVLASASDAKDLIRRANYLKYAQEHDKKLIYDTQQAKNDYQNQKIIFEDKKKKVEALRAQLVAYNTQIDQEKENKKKLLTETQGNEANYQRLISQARTQLAAFSRFTQSQGGASLLGNQTVCDDWGCYYNQRDSQWGGQSMGSYTLASDGCLVTSVAMVYSHYGHRSVTPATINANSNNFATYERGWLNKSVVADGKTLTRQTSFFSRNDSDSAKISSIDGAGMPVIIGVSYDSGSIPDHFVVITGGSNGNYQMHDPFVPNARNIPFTSKYSINSVRHVDRIQI